MNIGRSLVAGLVALAVCAGLSLGAWPGGGQAHAQQPVPALTKRVTDLTGTLSPDQAAQLEAQLAGIEQRKGAQVAILMVPSLGGEAIEQFGLRVAESWKIGRGSVLGRRVDDGVIVIVAKNDRKARIEVGYGLEGAIPDARAKRIVSDTIAPKFRADDYAGGLVAAVTELGRLIEGEALPAPTDRQRGDGRADNTLDGIDPLGLIAFVVFAGFIATRILGRVLGSIGTGVGAGVVATIAGMSLVTAVALGLGAFIVLLVLSSFGGLRRSGDHTYHSGPTIFTGGGSSGGWGGGGGGGGFSGGGGGFGGGGASGDW